MQAVGPQRRAGGNHLNTSLALCLARRPSTPRFGALPWDAQNKGAIMNIPERACQENSFPLGEEEARRESEEERRKIRRLQLMMSMVMSVISQDPSLTVEEASELAAGAKRAALAMFPDKELAYDLLYKPRVQRLMKERFRLQ